MVGFGSDHEHGRTQGGQIETMVFTFADVMVSILLSATCVNASRRCSTISEEGRNHGDRNGALAGSMRDIEILKRIG